ncbi:dihydrodipicolinate synthetase [Lactarius indigo]|nr:dihydrodipicolinate synthetase [Lactarius indigo]
MAPNGTADSIPRSTRRLTPGIFAPVPTFFIPESEDLDLQTLGAHVVRLARAGVRPLIAGTMGEGLHLAHGERASLGFLDVPIIVGTGGEAAAAGADAVIVITPGYFAGVLANHRRALKAFYVEVAEKSALPVLIYNYPGASAGIDLDSELIVDLAAACPNLIGVKTHSWNPEATFLVLGGYADFITSSAFVQGHGAITGPCQYSTSAYSYASVKLFELSEAATKDPSILPEAQRLQGVLARADFTIAKASISGTKFITEKLFGYGERLWEHPHVQELIKTERDVQRKMMH